MIKCKALAEVHDLLHQVCDLLPPDTSDFIWHRTWSLQSIIGAIVNKDIWSRFPDFHEGYEGEVI